MSYYTASVVSERHIEDVPESSFNVDIAYGIRLQAMKKNRIVRNCTFNSLICLIVIDIIIIADCVSCKFPSR